MKLRCRYCILALATFMLLNPRLSALDPAKSIFQFNCKNWTRLVGLPADKISAITQDEDGYLWLASQNGLIRYDGQTFTQVPVDLPSARGTNISALSRTKNGVLWFSIKDGGFGGFDGKKFVPFGDDRWPESSDASSLAVGRDGMSVLAGTVTGWGRWVPGSRETAGSLQNPNSVITMYEEPSGRVWLGTTLNGLQFWENGKIFPFADDRLQATNIHAITRDRDNDLWVATNHGLFRYDPALRPKEVYFPDAQVTSLLLDRDGMLWAGTNNAGLHRFAKGTFSNIGKLEGLGGDNVTALFEDKEGSLWVGTTEGVSLLSDLKFPIFSSREGITAGSATSVAAVPGGGLWIGTNTGATFLNGGHIEQITDRAVLKNPYVRRVFVAANGDVYLGDGSRNIVVLRNKKVIAQFSNELWPEAFVDDNGGVIAGIGKNLVRIREGQMTPYEFEGAPPDFNWVNDLARGRDGAIWAATNHGLFRIEGKTAQRWAQEDGLPSTRTHCVVADADGGVWCGMTTGLLRMKDGRTTHYGLRNGLLDARIFAIVPDQHGSLWLSSSRGILRVGRKNLVDFAEGKVDRIECTAFDGLESVKVVDRTDQGYSGCLTSDGRVWFPTPRGVLMIDPTAHYTNKVPPQVRIERVQVGEQEVTATQAAALTSAGRDVQFFFNALSYIAPDKTQIRYRLKGFDPDWIDGSTRRSVSYHQLPAGKYVFQIKAANADGVWSAEDTEFTIVFPAPAYLQPWFIALGGAIVLLGLYGGYKIKVRRFHQLQRKLEVENNLLETKVAERTDELANSVALLQATLDSTADGILAARHSGEVVSHNVQFAEMWRLPSKITGTSKGDELNQFLASQVKNPDAFNQRLAAITQAPDGEAFDIVELKDGRVLERYCRPQLVKGVRVGIVMNYRDITQRKQAEEKLTVAHKQLLETSRQAGMAEVATSVLHNVGNVLNSVNVSANLAIDQVRESKVPYVAKVARMLEANSADLASFLTNDEKGKKLVPYLTALSESLQADHASIADDLTQLSKNVDHIKEIVAMHQSFGRISGVNETVPVQDLIEDARRMHHASVSGSEVNTFCDYAASAVITVDRHKVMQILINLIGNAHDSCIHSTVANKQITLAITADDSRVQFIVKDNGLGIPRENLIRIFSHGFTTKKNGHGFGLHSAALTAKELGGSLVAHSEGLGQGATFVLDLPLLPESRSGTMSSAPEYDGLNSMGGTQLEVASESR
ncbi:MAG: two-component regulator propeller domain-containing protein [Opitutus sp.]